MGGTVAVTVREPDGTEHRMARWTNAFPDFVHDMRFIDKNPLYMAEYIGRWAEMRQDWLENHETENFKFNMTPCYGDYTSLAPEGYGLIVLDQKQNTILSMQGYTSFGRVHNSAVSLALDGNVVQFGFGARSNPSDLVKKEEITVQQLLDHLAAHDVYNYAVSFAGLFNNGHIKAVEVPAHQRRGFESVALGDAALDEVMKEYVLNDERRMTAFFQVDLWPYTVKHFEESADGAREMREYILKIGFNLSDEEEKIWADWIAEREEWEDEDDED